MSTNEAPHSTPAIARWRKRRREKETEAERRRAENEERLLRYRAPLRACPRGCGFHELGRRDVSFETSFWGSTEAVVSFEFETKICPRCGAGLVGHCARCKEEILAPITDLCRYCGLPQPWVAERRAGSDRASVRLWRPEDEEDEKTKGTRQQQTKRQANDPAEPLFAGRKKSKKGKVRGEIGDLWVIDGEIAQLDIDAVVSNDDVYGQMWAQSARAIKMAAGEGVERLAQEGQPFRLGHAWVTTAGNLQRMKGIVHVAATSRQGKTTLATVRECLAAALKVAVQEKYNSIGVTAFGTGPAGIETGKWFEMFAETTVAFLSDPTSVSKDNPLSIVLVLFERPDFGKDVETLRGVIRDAWSALGKPAEGELR